MVKTAYDMYTDQFQWKQAAYEYVFDKNPFDVVSGTDKIRKQIEGGVCRSVPSIAFRYGAVPIIPARL